MDEGGFSHICSCTDSQHDYQKWMTVVKANSLDGYRLLAIDTKTLMTEEILPRYAEMLEALLGRGEDERNPSVVGDLIAEWVERFNVLDKAP